MSWIMYCIRNRRTGDVLPNPRGHGGRGGTHVEPVAQGGPWPPRLFHTRQSAAAALRWWLGGRVTVSQIEGHEGDTDEDWRIEAAPERLAEDWCVVPITLNMERGTGSGI